jgi:hypothetical protein
MYINKRPIRTAGKSIPTAGTKIQGKKEAAYAPVIILRFLFYVGLQLNWVNFTTKSTVFYFWLAANSTQTKDYR